MKRTFFLSLAACAVLGACASAPEGRERVVSADCKLGGCSGQHCLDADADDTVTMCDWKPAYACYKQADCEKQADGRCGWTLTDELSECLEHPPEDAAPFMAH